MQTTLYIRLGSDPASGVQWYSSGPDGTVGRGELREAALRYSGARLCVLLPAAPLLSLSAELPPLQGQKLRRAVPYAVEEQLAEDVEAFHFALGKRQGDGPLPLLAVKREQMVAWQALFAEAECKPHLCLNEAQLLPWRPGELSLLLEPQGALLRLSAHEVYSLPSAGLQGFIELALERAPDEVVALRIFDARGEGAEVPAWQGGVAELEQHYQAVANPLKLFAEGDDGRAIDLLQGEFGRKEQLGRLWRPWRASAALLAVWLLLLGSEALFDYRRLSSEADGLYDQVVQVYRDTFPEAKNVAYPRVQMERKLAELQGGEGGSAFVNLMAATGPVLSATNGVALQKLRYRQGELELELELADLPALDALKASLQEKGLEVDIRNASSRDNRVEGRLAVRGTGS